MNAFFNGEPGDCNQNSVKPPIAFFLTNIDLNLYTASVWRVLVRREALFWPPEPDPRCTVEPCGSDCCWVVKTGFEADRSPFRFTDSVRSPDRAVVMASVDGGDYTNGTTYEKFKLNIWKSAEIEIIQLLCFWYGGLNYLTSNEFIWSTYHFLILKQ